MHIRKNWKKNMETNEMNNQAGITALMSSFGRAFHAEDEEHPVFADHLAKELMTADEYAAVQGYLLGGAQFFEPEIDPAALQPKVDHPLTQADKLERITRAGWAVPDNLAFVPVDFTKDSLAERLIAAGFDPSAKSFFSWLGVTYYLSAEAIDAMLASLSELCADGSALVFDYPDENFFDAPERRVQNTIIMAKAGGEPMKTAFSYSKLETMLEKHGFLIYELLTPDDIQKDVIDRVWADLKAFEHVNYCLAVRKE